MLARLAVLRRTLGVRTVFNLMAPLANPARPKRQLLGVADPKLLRPMGEALAALGVEHGLAVHGNDGLDEISLGASTRIVEVRGGETREYEITPEVALKDAEALVENMAEHGIALVSDQPLAQSSSSRRGA